MGFSSMVRARFVAAAVMLIALGLAYGQTPKLSFEVEGSDRTVDLLQRAADVAVRAVDPVQQSLVATKAGEIDIGLYASPDYVARRGLIKRLADAKAKTGTK